MSNDPRWGAKDRDKKAQAILQTIIHFTEISLKETQWLDIGCGSGGIAAAIAPNVQYMHGIDPENWSRWSEFQKQYDNLIFQKESIESLSCEDSSFDVIICNQVYEHVDNPQYLISEIYRILKPDGYCYFAGPNLLFPIEPHIFWPFVHWLPRKFAVTLLKFCGSGGVLDANSVSYWTLRRWLDDFQVSNALPDIIKKPLEHCKEGFFWQLLSYCPACFLSKMTWFSPGFVFVLRKTK